MRNKRSMTHDKGPPNEVYTVEQLGPSRYWTPEGFLYCKDVAIARTGEMPVSYTHLTLPTNREV